MQSTIPPGQKNEIPKTDNSTHKKFHHLLAVMVQLPSDRAHAGMLRSFVEGQSSGRRRA